MKRQLDATQQVFIEMKAYLYARFDCMDKQQLNDFTQYVQNNVIGRRMKIEYGTPTYVVLNEQENDYKFIHDEITVPVHIADLEKHFPVKDFTIPFYMHVLPKTCQVVLVFNHMITDARYIFNLITSYVEKHPLRQELFDSPCILLKPQIDKHTPIKKYIQPNTFQIPELPSKLNCQTSMVICQIDEVPFMKQCHTQRMSIISGLLKLRLLQKEGLITYENVMDWFSNEGINTFLVVVMDARCLVKSFKANCGNFYSFYRNSYKLLKDVTVGEITQKLREQLRDLTDQEQYLEHLGNVNPYEDSGMFEGILISAFGNLKTPFKKVNIKQHAYDDTNPGVLAIFTYTIDDQFYTIFQHNDQQAQYSNELRGWLTNLVHNCKDDITIKQLYDMLQ